MQCNADTDTSNAGAYVNIYFPHWKKENENEIDQIDDRSCLHHKIHFLMNTFY